MTATTAFTERRELAHRSSDGIEVTLFWSQATNRVTIAVFDSHSDERLEFDVEGSAALDAFKHPYAYAAASHVRNLAVSQIIADTMDEMGLKLPPIHVDIADTRRKYHAAEQEERTAARKSDK